MEGLYAFLGILCGLEIDAICEKARRIADVLLCSSFRGHERARPPRQRVQHECNEAAI